jgi:hypothetical protein
MNGAKPDTEALDLRVGISHERVVGERSVCSEAIPEGVVERTEVRMPV